MPEADTLPIGELELDLRQLDSVAAVTRAMADDQIVLMLTIHDAKSADSVSERARNLVSRG